MPELTPEQEVRKAEWWDGWTLRDPRPSRKPTGALVEWAIGGWGDPPPEWEEYVHDVREGDSPRGAGAPRLDVAGLLTHTAYAEAVVVLTVRDGLSLRRSFARAGQHFGVSPATIKKHWQGENKAVRQKDSRLWSWLRERPELLERHPISPEMDPDPAPPGEDQRGSEPMEPVDPKAAFYQKELAAYRRRQGVR